MNIDKRAVIAADNNADLYEAVFLPHGLRYERLPFGFVAHLAPLVLVRARACPLRRVVSTLGRSAQMLTEDTAKDTKKPSKRLRI